MAERFRVLENPDLVSSLQVVRDAIGRKRCLIVVGHCRVEYEGRARSVLEHGERIVMVKEDGAILVHRPSGYEPVNWQPAGCYFRTKLSGEELVLNAIRRSPHESLRIFFEKIFILCNLRMVDIGSFDLHVSEQEMQEAILAKPEILEEGFKPIDYEKRIEPGFLDIFGLDGKGRLVVVEIKRVRAGKDAVLQLAKYMQDVKGSANREVRGVLAAPRITKGVQKLLASLNLEYKMVSLEQCAEVIRGKSEKGIQDFLSEPI